MNRFKELIVWQKAMRLAIEVYKLSDKIPAKERFGLTSQLTRSAVSISSNIAEGSGRNSLKEYCYFLSIAQGSSFELETQILIGQKIKYYTQDDARIVLTLIQEIQNMLYSFQKTLKKKSLYNHIVINITLLFITVTTLYFVLDTLY